MEESKLLSQTCIQYISILAQYYSGYVIKQKIEELEEMTWDDGKRIANVGRSPWVYYKQQDRQLKY